MAMKLSESRFRTVMSMSAPVLMAVVAWVVWVAQGPVWLAVVVLLAAVALGWFVLFDYATAIEVDDSGIVRKCLLRSTQLRWDEVKSLKNPRRRGLVVETTNGTPVILLDRRLFPSEKEHFVKVAKRNGVNVNGDG